MKFDVVMPNLGFDTQEAQIVEWVRSQGDEVARGDVIAVIETDKASVELESVQSGVLVEQLYSTGESVPVGTVIARISSPPMEEGASKAQVQSPVSEPISPIHASPLARRVAEEYGVDLEDVSGSGSRGRIQRQDVEAYVAGAERPPSDDEAAVEIRTLPVVRKRAREAGINLTTVSGSGPQGAITVADFEAYLEQSSAPKRADKSAGEQELVVPDGEKNGIQEILLSRVRQVIGQRLQLSTQEAPHFYVTGELDMEAALSALRRMPSPQPSINDLLQFLTVQVLQHLPQFNAVYQNGRLYRYEAVNLSIAVAREDGLITPVIPDAGHYSLSGLALRSKALIKRARENRLQPQDLQAGTFTISNLGVVPQVDKFTAVINPPQVAILAIGTVKPRPAIISGGLHVRNTVHLTLSGDHRVLDGMDLAQFLAAFEDKLDHFAHSAP